MTSNSLPDTSALKRRPFSTWIAFVVGIISAVASASFLLFAQQDRSVQLRDLKARAELELLAGRQEEALSEALRSREQAESLAAALEKAKAELALLSARAVAPKIGEQSAELAKQLGTMRTTVEKVAGRIENLDKQSASVDQRMVRIESVILAEPQKAIELPLLKRDFQSLQQQLDRDLNSLRAENARVYDLMKWLVGLMALVSLSLIGAAVGNVFRREPAKEAPPASRKESELNARSDANDHA